MAAPNANPLEQIKTFLARYTPQQKLALAGSAGLVLTLLWVLVYSVNRVESQTLYTEDHDLRRHGHLNLTCRARHIDLDGEIPRAGHRGHILL